MMCLTMWGVMMSEIGKLLKMLRGDMTFREAAEKSGLSHSYIRYIENGKRPGSETPINPSPETLKALSKAYNYPYEELMEKAGYLKKEDNLNDKNTEGISDQRKKMIEAVKGMTEEQAKALYELTKHLMK